MNSNKPRVVVYVNTDYVLAFLTATIVFAMFVFVGLASIAADNSIEQMTAIGSETTSVTVTTTS